MEFRQLRYFLAVAECQSFTRGAEKVSVSQPSLSVQIAALEDELGAPLFDRLGRQVALTEAGRLFRDHAQRVMRETELAAQSIQDLTGAEQGRLVVGSISTVNSYLIPPLVCRFKQRFPRVHLHVRAQTSSTIEEELLANHMDLGLCLLPITNDRLVTNRLFTETLSLVAPPGFRMIAKRVRMRELSHLPLVLLPSDYCLRQMIDAECASAGASTGLGGNDVSGRNSRSREARRRVDDFARTLCAAPDLWFWSSSRGPVRSCAQAHRGIGIPCPSALGKGGSRIYPSLPSYA